MQYHLAQLNIAKFKKDREHTDNATFFDNIDRVNAIAEAHPGFIWRYDDDDDTVFTDPNTLVNVSVWKDVQALSDFAFRDKGHVGIMQRRNEWFEKVDVRLVLWWVKAGHQPSLAEAKSKLDLLTSAGPTQDAFTFRKPFPPPK